MYITGKRLEWTMLTYIKYWVWWYNVMFNNGFFSHHHPTFCSSSSAKPWSPDVLVENHSWHCCFYLSMLRILFTNFFINFTTNVAFVCSDLSKNFGEKKINVILAIKILIYYVSFKQEYFFKLFIQFWNDFLAIISFKTSWH